MVNAKNAEVVNWLTQYGLNVSIQKPYSNKNNPEGRTALFGVIFEGKKDIFDALLANKIDVNLADIKGTTALMYAAQLGELEMLQKLLLASAHVNDKDFFGKTALCYVDIYLFNQNRKEIKSILQGYGAVCE